MPPRLTRPDADPSVAATAARFGDLLDRLYSSQVADSLDVLGFRDQVMHAGINPLRRGLRAFGPAATLQFSPIASDPGPDPYRTFIDYMDAIAPRSVAVLATSTSERSGVWGELFSAAAIGAGVAGMVTDGSHPGQRPDPRTRLCGVLHRQPADRLPGPPDDLVDGRAGHVRRGARQPRRLGYSPTTTASSSFLPTSSSTVSTPPPPD